MVTMAQRIEALRTERNMSRPELSAALGFPRTAIEKFETGRQTPTKDQQRKLAAYFDVTLENLQGVSEDGGMSLWMSDDTPVSTPVFAPPAQSRKPAKVTGTGSDAGNMFDGFLNSKKFQDAIRAAALDILRSPEGEEILANVVRRELTKQRK